MSVKLVLDDNPRDGAVRVDLAWNLFFDSKPSIPEGHGGRLLPFTNWLWDELGRKSGRLNRNSRAELSLTVPALDDKARDFLVRIVSFWSDDVRMRKKGELSENLWKKPVVNVLDDANLDGAEKSSTLREDMSYERYLMPLLGPGRAFFKVEVIQPGESAARFHSHSEVDEYYLILEGTGTLRHNDNDVMVKKGDLIGKPTGPDNSSMVVADKGEPLRILDMEVWHARPYISKDVIVNPDFNEIIMRGQGWGAIIPAEALMTSEDFRKHYDEGYRRSKDGGWTPSKLRGHRKVREKSAQ